jgi:hypothetical protein
MTKQLIFVQLIIPAMSHKPETVIWLEPLLALVVLLIFQLLMFQWVY